MTRETRRKDRVLRDGREVTVLKVFVKPSSSGSGYPRQAARVQYKDTGAVDEIWYTKLAPLWHEKSVRTRRDSGKETWSLANANSATTMRTDLDSKRAFAVDGLVLSLAHTGTSYGGQDTFQPKRLAVARVLEVATQKDTSERSDRLGVTKQTPLRRARVRCGWRNHDIIEVTDDKCVHFAGPGYAKLWRTTPLPQEHQSKEAEAADSLTLVQQMLARTLREDPAAALPDWQWRLLEGTSYARRTQKTASEEK